MNLRDSKNKKTIALTSLAASALLAVVAAPLITQQRSAAQAPSSSSMNITTTETTTTGPPGSLLKLSRANVPMDIPLKQGYVNGNPVFYINTDISDQKFAGLLTNTTGFKVNYAPLIAQAPSDAVAQISV
jgi:hypothetical protein